MTLLFSSESVGILILNVCVYKYLENRNRSLSIATKFLLGMCFALASMCVAGIVEIFRQKQCTSGNVRSINQLFDHFIGCFRTRNFSIISIYSIATVYVD